MLNAKHRTHAGGGESESEVKTKERLKHHINTTDEEPKFLTKIRDVL